MTKKMYQYRLYPIYVMVAFLCFACHKKEEDPCTAAHQVTAHFKMEETDPSPGIDDYWKDYETDTIIGVNARFTADEEDATYEWRIGAKTYTTRVVNLNFQSAPKYSTIPITLIVHKKPNLECFPGDDGIDTFIKQMYITSNTFFTNHAYQGYYTDNPKDTFTVSFYMKIRDSIQMDRHLYADNLLRGCIGYLDDNKTIIGYKEIALFGYMDQCGIQNGLGVVTDNLLDLTFNYADPKDRSFRTIIMKHFIGHLKK